jgi:ribonuclease P protein component
MKKEYRVKKSKEIEAILKQRRSVGNKYFVLYEKENHDIDHFRFAVSVPKKFGNAVQRNKMKRQVREIIAKLDINPKLDLFLVVKKEANSLDFQTTKNMIEGLMKKQNTR